jgi:predicted unusual protein kinase regulating ubiquinone biosynthesis (AarF/ABC1/UbiB family)
LLLIKALVTIEGVARSLHPELDLAAAAVPVVLRSLAPRWMQRLIRGRA